jgi:hypothetical protein
MRTTKFFGYLPSPRVHEQVQREIQHGRGEYRGPIVDIAAVVYQNKGIYTGRGIDSSNLVAYYAKQSYPGLKDQSDARKKHAEYEALLERRNKPAPVYDRIMTDEITVNREVFTRFLMHNSHRILVGSPLPDPVEWCSTSSDERAS